MSDATPLDLEQRTVRIPAGMIKALLAIQGELAESDLIKNRKADAGRKVYGYADLPAVLDHILAVARKHGVLVTQVPVMEVQDELAIATVLAIASGEQVAAVMRFPRAGDAQALGSAVTYLRRYSLLSLFALAPEEDDDDGKRAVEARRQAAASTPKPAGPTWDLAAVRALLRTRLTEAFPSEAEAVVAPAVLGKVAEALFGCVTSQLTPAQLAEWGPRLRDMPVETVIDKAGLIVGRLREAPVAAPATGNAAAPTAPADPEATERKELLRLALQLAREVGAALVDEDTEDTAERALLLGKADKLKLEKVQEALGKFRAPTPKLRDWARERLKNSGLIKEAA